MLIGSIRGHIPREFVEFMQKETPELWESIRPDPMRKWYIKLNAALDMNVSGIDRVGQSCDAYHKKLIQMKEAGALPK